MGLELLQSWLLTYLLHGTLLLLAAFLIVRLLPRSAAAFQEALWRTALFGGLVTATVQLGLSGSTQTPVGVAPATASRVDARAAEPFELRPDTPHADRQPRAAVRPAAAPSSQAPVADAGTSAPAVGLGWAAALAGVWALSMLLFVARDLRTRRRLNSRIAARVPLASGPMRETLDGLCWRAGLCRSVRLTSLEGLPSPIALGIRHPEIVVPTRALEELSPIQQEVMLAHELAHHVRRDPLWLALGRGIEALFFFQPLNRLARRHLKDTAEMLADGWAVQQTGNGRALAECLTVVARWMVGEQQTLPATAMAGRGSILHRRVERLLDRPQGSADKRGALRLAAVLPVALVAVLAPAVLTRPATASAPRPLSQTVLQPSGDKATAFALLDAEIAALQGELETLLGLLAGVKNAPPELRRGLARLEARLVSLREEHDGFRPQMLAGMEKNR